MKDWSDIKTKKQLKKRYLSYVPALMKIAQSCGYALALHGSASRDLDLLAAPWVKNAMSPETLVMALEKSLTGHALMRSYRKREGVSSNKPHGRKAYTIAFAILSNEFKGMSCGYPQRHAIIDLSVMPRS